MMSLMGTTPTANAVADLAQALGFAVTQTDDLNRNAMADSTVAVIIASHGGDEAGAIRGALDADVPYVGLVASSRRADGILGGFAPDERARVHAPVGLDIGARTPPEIALSIMADLVGRIRRDGLAPATTGHEPEPLQVVDPVCGRAVTVVSDTPHAVIDGTEFWFCNPG